MGRPLPTATIKLVDEAGQPCPEGAPGEILVQAAQCMEGYWDDSAATAQALADGWLHTGDIGRFDAAGYLYIVDRKKDMIISGGFNVYPSDLEAALRQHPCVAEAAVVGVPSERWGETPVAFVVLRRAAEADGAALLDWCNARVGKTQRLAAVHLVDRLPRNALGKVLKRELRERWLPVSGDNPARAPGW